LQKSLLFSLPWREGVRGRREYTLTLILSRLGRGILYEIMQKTIIILKKYRSEHRDWHDNY